MHRVVGEEWGEQTPREVRRGKKESQGTPT